MRKTLFPPSKQTNATGVILSGMGLDGTLGLRAIKEKAGAVFVQEPASAKFSGMPRSAIEAGRADEDLMEKEQSALEKVVILLRAQTGLQTHFTDRTAELGRARENSPSAASTHGRKKP